MTDDLNRKVGEEIARRRCQESHRVTADAAGLNVERLRLIERGEPATMGELRSIACALGTSVESLFPGGKIP